MKVSASIVLYKSNKQELKKVINSTNKSSIDRLFLIDNSPTDKLKIFVESLSCKIEYVFGHGNIGYGAAHNIAIKKSMKLDVKYHLIINPDIEFKKNTIEELIKYMNNNSDVGLIMPKVNYPDGNIQYLCKLLATPFDLILRRFIPFKNLVKRNNFKYELRFTGYNQTMQVPSLSGCFMFLNTSILKQVKGFDERFFMYCEDFDLCRRIGQVSKTIYYPKVSIVHNHRMGSYKNNKLLFYHIRSAIKYFNKWGWFFDNNRKRINLQTLKRLGYHK